MSATRHIKVPDDSLWPLPDMEDDDSPVSWKLRYAPDSMTRAEQLFAASVIQAYGYLVVDATKTKRDLVAKTIRDHLETAVQED